MLKFHASPSWCKTFHEQRSVRDVSEKSKKRRKTKRGMAGPFLVQSNSEKSSGSLFFPHRAWD